MENAVEALKIAFAVFVFAIAVALSFSVVGQVRSTADVVLALEDKTGYYDYVDNNDINASDKERIVGFETILPAIYRYAEEQYAVTIVDKNGDVIARYDLWLEGFMNNWDEVLKNAKKNYPANITKDPTIKAVKDRLSFVENNIKVNNNTNIKIYDNLNTIYNVTSKNNINIKHGAPWVGDSYEIIKRIKCDLDGSSYERNGITYKGKELNKYKNNKFIEKFIEIQTSGTTITDTDENGNVEYSLETVKGNKKLEIIYIMQ